jgi:hypothetical protein
VLRAVGEGAAIHDRKRESRQCQGIASRTYCFLDRAAEDGRIIVSLIGVPTVAKDLGLHGDQYMGWLGVEPDELTGVQVSETRWA